MLNCTSSAYVTESTMKRNTRALSLKEPVSIFTTDVHHRKSMTATGYLVPAKSLPVSREREKNWRQTSNKAQNSTFATKGCTCRRAISEVAVAPLHPTSGCTTVAMASLLPCLAVLLVCAGLSLSNPIYYRSSGSSTCYDHQTKTYHSRFEPVSCRDSCSVTTFFSPDHSIDTYVKLIESATSSIDIYTPGELGNL